MLVLSYHMEAGVDGLGQGLALGGLDGGFDALVANADRVLGDRAGFGAGADGIHLLLTGVVTDDHDLAFHAQFLDGVQHADDRAFVGAEEALQVRVSLDDGLGKVGGFELIAATVLGVDDGDVGILGL